MPSTIMWNFEEKGKNRVEAPSIIKMLQKRGSMVYDSNVRGCPVIERLLSMKFINVEVSNGDGKSKLHSNTSLETLMCVIKFRRNEEITTSDIMRYLNIEDEHFTTLLKALSPKLHKEIVGNILSIELEHLKELGLIVRQPAVKHNKTPVYKINIEAVDNLLNGEVN